MIPWSSLLPLDTGSYANKVIKSRVKAIINQGQYWLGSNNEITVNLGLLRVIDNEYLV